jgi:hypothetical protein
VFFKGRRTNKQRRSTETETERKAKSNKKGGNTTIEGRNGERK